MKKIKLFLCVALFGAMSFGAFSAYDYLTMSAEEKALLENVEALSDPENEPGGGDGYRNGRNQYCAIPEGKQGCIDSPLRKCNNDVFCIR